MEVNYYKLLDNIIWMMKENPNSMSDSMIQEEIAKPLAHSNYNSERDFPVLWQQLKDDEIVIKLAINGNWRLSIKGLSFEGYDKRQERLTREFYDSRVLASRQMKLQKWMLRVTWILAFGTSIAAVYYAIEIWKFCNPWWHK